MKQSAHLSVFLPPTDNIGTTEQKCADALNVFEQLCHLVLIVKETVIDKSTFTTMAHL